MQTKWQRIFGITVLLNILTILMYIVLNHDFKDNNKPPTLVADSNVVSEERCSNSSLPIEHLHEGTWLPVGEEKHAYVFSAYFINKTKSEVVIIGVKTRDISACYCQHWHKTGENAFFVAEETPAHSSVIPEGHGLRYLPVLFSCSASSLPTYVSMVTKSSNRSLNLLLVHHVANSKVKARNFTVCLAPLNLQYSRVYELVEWIELNRILGADKFIVYNYSSGSNVTNVLDFYSERGLVEVVQWRLPMLKEDEPIEIHYFGQVAALNDCLYRNKYQSEFIVNLDLDEFIIPHSKNVTSWYELLNELKKDAHSFIFRSTFFKKEWDNAGVDILNKTKVDKFHLVTLQKLQREKKIFSYGNRSKYFTRPSNVSSVMIHTVFSVSRAFSVPAEKALVHHYRHLDTKNDQPNAKLMDKTVQEKFGEDLIRNVEFVWSELDKKRI